MKLPGNIYTVLKENFNKKDLSDLEKKLIFRKRKISSKINKSPKLKEQLETNFPPVDKEIKSTIDFIVTFSDENFPKKKFLEFLLSFGESLVESSYLDEAKTIFYKIVAETNSDEKLKKFTAESYFNIADIFSRQVDFDLSFSFARKAVKIFKTLDDRTGLAKCENLFGTIYGDLGKLKTAKKHFDKCSNYLGNKRNPLLKGKVLINSGILEIIYGNTDSAYSNFNKALKIFQGKNSICKSYIHHNIGMVYIKKRDFKNALKELDKSINISLQNNYFNLLSISYSSKAYLFSQTKDFELADAFADKSIDIALTINDRLTIADNYKIKGIILREKNKMQEAENYLLTGLRMNKDFDNELNRSETEFEIALLYKKFNKDKLSRDYLESALKYYKKTGSVREIMELYNNY